MNLNSFIRWKLGKYHIQIQDQGIFSPSIQTFQWILCFDQNQGRSIGWSLFPKLCVCAVYKPSWTRSVTCGRNLYFREFRLLLITALEFLPGCLVVAVSIFGFVCGGHPHSLDFPLFIWDVKRNMKNILCPRGFSLELDIQRCELSKNWCSLNHDTHMVSIINRALMSCPHPLLCKVLSVRAAYSLWIKCDIRHKLLSTVTSADQDQILRCYGASCNSTSPPENSTLQLLLFHFLPMPKHQEDQTCQILNCSENEKLELHYVSFTQALKTHNKTCTVVSVIHESLVHFHS